MNQKDKDQEKTKKHIYRNKTRPGAKNHKSQNTKHKKSQKEESLEVLSWGGKYIAASPRQDLQALLLL